MVHSRHERTKQHRDHGTACRIPGQPDTTRDRNAFLVRCSARERERQLGTGYGGGHDGSAQQGAGQAVASDD